MRFASSVLLSGVISIHALREEGDPGCHDHCERYAEFLSTPSARRATRFERISARICTISIHALREEGDFFKMLKNH